MDIVNKPFLIGETAFHHQGDINYLKQLIDAGIENGADSIKFHLLFNLDQYFIKEHAAYNALNELLLTPDQWSEIHLFIISKNYKPIYLCNDIDSIHWVISLASDEVLAIEVHATSVNDVLLLKEAAKFNGIVLLGSGGSTIDELHFAIDFLKKEGKENIILMHGFQNYPTDYKDIVFSKMKMLQDLFNLQVGYADHTDPNDKLNEYVSCLPQANGFTLLEKHFTLDKTEQRVDSQAAVDLTQFKKIKELMTIVYSSYGNNALYMSEAELKYGDTGPMKKAIIAKHKIEAGQVVTINDIFFKRTNESSSLRQKDLSLIIGSISLKEINEGEILSFENLKYTFKKASTEQFFIHKK